MSTNFPTSVDSFVNPSTGSYEDVISHSAQHTNINDAVYAVESFLLNNQPTYQNIIENGNFNNASTNGYGGTPDSWTNSSANPIQGGFPSCTKQELIDLLGVTSGQIQGLWNLNGNFSDLSSNGYTLTASGSPTDTSDGMMAQAKSFVRASSQYATNTSASNVLITGDQTYFCLFKLSSLPGAAMNIMGHADATPTNYSQVAIGSAGNVVFRLTGLTTNAVISSDVVVEAGKWYFVVGKYDSAASELSITVNGIKKSATASGAHGVSGTQAFSIGRTGLYNAEYLDGVVQNAGVLSTAISDNQIKSLWSFLSFKGLKIRRSGSDCYLYQSLSMDLVESLRGSTLTLRSDINQDVASIAQISIYDGSTETNSSTFSTTGSFSTKTVSKAISSTATQITVRLKCSTTNGNVWFKNVSLYQGDKTIPYAPSAKDWSKFPRLLLQIPPSVLGAYQYEEGRWYSYTPTYSGLAPMTWTSVSTSYSKFKVDKNTLTYQISATGTTGGTASSSVIFSSPALITSSATSLGWGGYINNTGSSQSGFALGYTSTQFRAIPYNGGNWSLGAGSAIQFVLVCELQ